MIHKLFSYGLAKCILVVLATMGGNVIAQSSAQVIAAEIYIHFDVKSGILQITFYNVGMETRDEKQLRQGVTQLKALVQQHKWVTTNFDLPAFTGMSEEVIKENGYIKVQSKLKTDFTESSVMAQIWEGLFRTKCEFKEVFKVGEEIGRALFFENPSLKIGTDYVKVLESGPTKLIHWQEGDGLVLKVVVGNRNFENGTALAPYF